MEPWEEEGLAKIPNLELAQWVFQLKLKGRPNYDKVKKDLFDIIKAEGADNVKKGVITLCC